MDRLSDYDYELPPDRIAHSPSRRRDEARLLVIDRATGRFSDHTIGELPMLLEPGDCLVFNNTRVLPARLQGFRSQTGGKWEGLFLELDETGHWNLLGQTRGRLQPGEEVTIVSARDQTTTPLQLTMLEQGEGGIWRARPSVAAVSHVDLLETYGTVPLPPYIERETPEPADWERYQTTFARHPGSVAAPTAGLHFTPELISECQNTGIARTDVTLHVGIGTFRPISVERLDEHRMHSEWCQLSSVSAGHLNEIRKNGGRVVPVGTTSVRTLESACGNRTFKPFEGRTDLFIRPPYEFQAADVLITNFHLPKSSLLVLVSAFAGRELIMAAYRHAIESGYRFFSYGDAMLIL